MESVLYALTRFWAALRRLERPYRTIHVDDIPESPKPGVIYVVGEGGHQWFACFLCPCSCGELIQLNTLPTGRPRWKAVRHWNGTTSLRPSVRRTVGCRSHFFVRHGSIKWS